MPGQLPSALASGKNQNGPTAETPEQTPGSLKIAAAAEGDAEGGEAGANKAALARKFAQEPWFAKLPPGLRTAIESKTRLKAPRGYEERLKRYFESVD